MYKVSKWKDIDQKMNNEYIEFKLCELQAEIDHLMDYKELLDEYFNGDDSYGFDELLRDYKVLERKNDNNR